jgi:hypothetical protein
LGSDTTGYDDTNASVDFEPEHDNDMNEYESVQTTYVGAEVKSKCMIQPKIT